MFFDGCLVETVKHTHKVTSFTEQYLKFYSVGHSQSTATDNGSARLSQQRHFWCKEKRRQPMPCSVFIDDGIFKR